MKLVNLVLHVHLKNEIVKLMEVVNHIFDRRGSLFYDFNEQIFARQFLWHNFIGISQYSQRYDIVCQMALLRVMGGVHKIAS